MLRAMPFTALHRALGKEPGPLTTELLDDAVQAGVQEAGDLDWKKQLLEKKGLPNTDFPKDVAAMANSGGGLIIFGVREEQKAACMRVDAGECDEGYERTLRSAACTAISPPVFDLTIHKLGTEPPRAVIVEVSASVDGPHLVYRGDYFGAPIRNDADTVWMKERQIEAMYRARFDERRRAVAALDALFIDAVAGRDTDTRAWMIAVARPRIPVLRQRMERDTARRIVSEAYHQRKVYAPTSPGAALYPLDNVDRSNPRIGLRRWIAVNSATGENERWKESWVSIHEDGAVTIATVIGGRRKPSDGHFWGNQVPSSAIEHTVAEFMALLRTTAQSTGDNEYEVRVGIEWSGPAPIEVHSRADFGVYTETTPYPLHRYTPVETSVDATAPDTEYQRAVYDLALSCVNQGGVPDLHEISVSDK